MVRLLVMIAALVACTSAIQQMQSIHPRSSTMQKKWAAFVERGAKYNTVPNKFKSEDLDNQKCPKNRDEPSCAAATQKLQEEYTKVQNQQEMSEFGHWDKVCAEYWSYSVDEDARRCKYIREADVEGTVKCILGPGCDDGN
mmetsp:Transcript_34381/g.67711  ORF Transcript_34381/g.67711 Transcript_34381/m.67711 type:complete len:141 (-) Transcript_34381:330-752(-)|eukprot:CAMPEP_0175139294 /NCGR_PEP_ID=MMETSP0087-20121206/10823_1 /TAXON_ID=136419 /ORGANISM="Unknown Unknown, Strain D1" /LENGTH=140 /DNA_ID=CAMNT_0016422289 /DNA_START=36 /DNA_END=458 /DNA_ORIENTATION=+